MVSITKALVASVLLVQAAGVIAQTAPMDDRAMCAATPEAQRTDDERRRCAAPVNVATPEMASSAAQSNLAGGIVAGSIMLATLVVAITGGSDGLDTVAPTPIIPPVPTTTTTSTSTRTR